MWRETLRLAVYSIVDNRLRAFLTTLGIIFGVMAVIAVVAIVQGVFAVYTSQLEGLGAGFMFAIPGNPDSTEKIRASPMMTLSDAEFVSGKVEDVVAATPYFTDRRTLQARGQTATAIVMPASERYPEIQNHFVADGRFFTALEMRNRARVVVLGPDLADQLELTGPNAVGSEIRLYGVPFTVIGIMEKKGGINAFGQPYDQGAIVPYATALGFSGPQRGGILLIKLGQVSDVDRSKEEIRRALRQSHRLRPGEADDFNLITQSEILESVSSITDLATWIVLAIVGVALLVGGIGIMNIMLVSVTERTKEIGVRMALGATRQDIMAQFLTESVMLALLGGVVGIGAGYAVAWLVAVAVPDFPDPQIPAWAIALAFGFCAAIGVFFGLYPAAKAARLDPIDALRYE